MSKDFPLQTLLELSQQHLDDATKQLGKLISGEQEANQRLSLLQQYRTEYQARFNADLSNGMRRDTLNNYRVFFSRLETAIQQAEQMVTHSQFRTAQGRREWVERRGRKQAYDTLSQRFQERERRQENRREQKLSDEHAARKFSQHEPGD